MKIMIVDGQGGGIGKAVIERLRASFADMNILAVGTNSIATSAMLKAGASCGATGENPIIVNCAKCDVIVGAMGIVLANALMGEITPRAAEAIASSSATKILIPQNRCGVMVAGTVAKPLAEYIDDVVTNIEKLILK